MKHVTGVYTAPRPHWVGDGFPVRSMFSYQSHAEQLSPFLLLDYAGPHTFTPGNEKRGVGEHPHRGFETVTIVYSGEVEHRDSTGRGGIIGPGDYGRTHLTQLVISYLNGTLTACVNGGYDFVDVRDVADGIISCVENGRAGECYILSNQFYTIQEVLDDLHEITGKRRLKSILPLWFAKLTAPLAEVWYKMLRQPPLYTSYSLYTLESNGNFSHDKATQELGYHPRSMKDTLTDMAYWLESYNRIKFKFKTAHAV